MQYCFYIIKRLTPMTFEEVVNYRRSIRFYKNLSIDTERVKHCLELASLAPNSPNMQLWEFYHITDADAIKQLSVACFNFASLD